MPDRRFDLAVVGLGYVGLPLVIEGVRSGLRVAGLDVSEAVVAGLRNGKSHVDDIGDDDIATALDRGFTPTTDPAVLGEADAVVIAVPTPLDRKVPDLSAVIAATKATADHLSRGQLVVLESTTYPGTTEEVVLPLLEGRSKLRAGSDFHLAFSPERIDPGNSRWTLRNTPKVVAGIDEASTARAAAFYGTICDTVVTVSGTREAEMTKLLENTYRHVNIALVNELAILCHELDIDIWEAISAAATKPFGFQPFHPGPGVGGHCIPIDPNYLSYAVRQLGHQFRFVELAQEINDRMPRYVVDRAMEALNEHSKPLRGSSVLLLGLTYKADVADLRESPALQVARLLTDRGALLTACDPLLGQLPMPGITMVDDPVAAAAVSDIVIVLTPHRVFDLDAITAAAPLLLDTRGVVRSGNAIRL
ncbi:MAG: nucleotide sugar dehydrogenase [Actinobacteria bacterium]|nr:MAG: nucleotide sugar dehydrogenase [Actinomycetota bacterium]